MENTEIIVDDYIRILNKPVKAVKPLLIGLVGGFCSGKSYLAAKLSVDLDLIFIKIDEVKRFFVPRPEYLNQDKAFLIEFIFLTSQKLATEGYGVVTDINLATKEYRNKFRTLVTKGNSTIIYTYCSREIALKRIEEKNLRVNSGSDSGIIVSHDYFDLENASIESPSDADYKFNSETNEGYLMILQSIRGRYFDD